MNGIDPIQLQAFLDLLVEAGVEEFEGAGIHVRFTPGLFAPENKVDPAESFPERERTAEVKSLWEMPTLWPGGEAPKFPGTPGKK